MSAAMEADMFWTLLTVVLGAAIYLACAVWLGRHLGRRLRHARRTQTRPLPRARVRPAVWDGRNRRWAPFAEMSCFDHADHGDLHRR